MVGQRCDRRNPAIRSVGAAVLCRWVPSGVISIPDRGPREPPPLSVAIEWRPESSKPFWLIDADGAVLGMYDTSSAAQAELAGNVIQRGASNA